MAKPAVRASEGISMFITWALLRAGRHTAMIVRRNSLFIP
jgi:hypothetical protein